MQTPMPSNAVRSSSMETKAVVPARDVRGERGPTASPVGASVRTCNFPVAYTMCGWDLGLSFCPSELHQVYLPDAGFPVPEPIKTYICPCPKMIDEDGSLASFAQYLC